jgi:hypothetical protein
MTVGRLEVRDERLDRVAAATGIGFVAFALAAFLLALGPGEDEEVGQYYADNATAVEWQAFLFGLAGFFLLWFFGTLAAATRPAHAAETRLPAIMLASAGVTVGLYFVGVASTLTIAKLEGAAPFLFDFGSAAFALSNFSAAALIGSASLALLRTAVLPLWVGYSGLALMLLLWINGGAQTLSDSDVLADITFVVFLLWTLVASALLTRSRWFDIERVPRSIREPEAPA